MITAIVIGFIYALVLAVSLRRQNRQKNMVLTVMTQRLQILRRLVAKGVQTNGALADAMGCTRSYVSQLGTLAQGQGWLKVIGRKYTLVEQSHEPKAQEKDLMVA